MDDSKQLEVSRTLPNIISIPEINGEMVHLRPATLDDCAIMDELDAYYNASRITGKDEVAERTLVHTWVGRSVAWSQGITSQDSGVGDPEARRTIAWAVLTDPTGEGKPEDGQVIGMIFLIDIDGWAKSARIQIMLGRDYRGRGYSRDAMPRVMTYGFASRPAGLGMHRIWVAVPEKNTRSLSVYQSLGFVLEGTSRHALWDDSDQRYQDQMVLGTLVDEFDPIRSLDAFGMHLIEDNPGVREALAAREHSMSIVRNEVSQALRNQAATVRGTESDSASQSDRTDQQTSITQEDKQRTQYQQSSHRTETERTEAERLETERTGAERTSATGSRVGRSIKATTSTQDYKAATDDDHSASDSEVNTKGGSSWSYVDSSTTHSKHAWWRNLGRGRSRENNE